MIPTLLLLAAPLLPASAPLLAPAPPPAPAPSLLQDGDHSQEYEKRRKAAEGSVEKLWELYDWCDAYGMEREARSCLRAILKIDDDDRKAHELLGEVFYDGKWFPSEKMVQEYQRKQLEAQAKSAGKVIHDGELVDPADLPFLEKGLVKTRDGRWVTAQEHQRIQEGWVRQDLTWIPPDEIPQMEKGLWKCGDQWLTTEEANEFHSRVGQWWQIPGDHFLIYSTCPRDVAEKALYEAERTYSDLVRIFGRAPDGKVIVLVLNAQEQYNRFAADSPVELRGFSSLHGAFLAEIWIEPLQAGYPSPGVAYWDSTTNEGNSWGPTFVRHAAGLSFGEALDPSPKTLAKLAGGGAGDSATREFWAEKKLPAWFRYGAAVYPERYFIDSNPSTENPLWARQWSIQNIANKGGLDPLDRIFEFELTLEDQNGSGKLMNEAGLLVAFLIDGKCKPVMEKHQALKAALQQGKDLAKPALALEAAIKENETQLRQFAGL